MLEITRWLVLSNQCFNFISAQAIAVARSPFLQAHVQLCPRKAGTLANLFIAYSQCLEERLVHSKQLIDICSVNVG